VILGTVESGAAEPVLPRQLARIADAESPLLGGVDEEQPSEGPERLSAQALLRFLVEQQHPPARLGQLGARDKARETGSHNDHICVHSRTVS
jgi:hypothetical protein